MCICVNCRHTHRCQTYFFIEQQHFKFKKHLKDFKFIFMPQNTVININIKQKEISTVIDWDLIECSSFTEKPGNWLIKHDDVHS